MIHVTPLPAAGTGRDRVRLEIDRFPPDGEPVITCIDLRPSDARGLARQLHDAVQTVDPQAPPGPINGPITTIGISET